jgi:hypothetical protein
MAGAVIGQAVPEFRIVEHDLRTRVRTRFATQRGTAKQDGASAGPRRGAASGSGGGRCACRPRRGGARVLRRLVVTIGRDRLDAGWRSPPAPAPMERGTSAPAPPGQRRPPCRRRGHKRGWCRPEVRRRRALRRMPALPAPVPGVATASCSVRQRNSSCVPDRTPGSSYPT